MKWPWSDSIASRIRWGYYVLIAIIALGFTITAIYLSRVGKQIYALEKVTKVTDTVLEIRRYEKNWILYQKKSDYEMNRQQTRAVLELLRVKPEPFSAKGGGVLPMYLQLYEMLQGYDEMMVREFDYYIKAGQHQTLEQVREKGKILVEQAEELSNSVRNSIDGAVRLAKASALAFLLGSFLLAVFLGRKLSSSVVNPLQGIVACTKKIAAGEAYNLCKTESNMELVEVRTVLEAFELMLKQLEHRERLIIKSEKLAAVGTLVAGVAHELNNPLSNAGTSAQILLEEMRESENVPRQFQMDMLEQITGETDRARGIVRSLLEFAREKKIDFELVKIEDIVHQTIDLVRGEIPTQVELRVELDYNVILRADKQRLQQALINLLLNAFQAAEGAAQVVVRTKNDLERMLIVLEIEDNGPGMPEEIRKRVFDPFFTTKDVGEGSGLGLAITREIIDKHEGEIRVESQLGKGTKFIISLPIKNSDQPEVG